jgi:serine/threonine protein phosphatase 1
MPTYAIGDIHGCRNALDRILGVVRPSRDDTMILLGDYVNRGSDSRGVIDRILYLQNETNLIAIRGNHDASMVAAREDPRARQMWQRIGGDATLGSYPGRSLDGVPPDHWSFLTEFCRDWYETGTHIYVHATVDPNRDMGEQSTDNLYWQRLDPRAKAHRSGKKVICGHTSQHGGRPLDLGHTVCLDTGCVYGLWLTCLEVETGRYWQASDAPEVKKTPEGRLGA